jgi:hypothetical protein
VAAGADAHAGESSATVASGVAMGTEAPAAYLGVAADVCIGDRGRWWRRLLRPRALAAARPGSRR